MAGGPRRAGHAARLPVQRHDQFIELDHHVEMLMFSNAQARQAE
jgi:hypothetical protein